MTKYFDNTFVCWKLVLDCRVLVVFIRWIWYDCLICTSKLINLSRQQIHLIEYVQNGKMSLPLAS